nr:PREDICTED: protein phosphatase 1 regulatory subunit 3C-B-like [Notothenia coriiceps]
MGNPVPGISRLSSGTGVRFPPSLPPGQDLPWLKAFSRAITTKDQRPVSLQLLHLPSVAATRSTIHLSTEGSTTAITCHPASSPLSNFFDVIKQLFSDEKNIQQASPDTPSSPAKHAPGSKPTPPPNDSKCPPGKDKTKMADSRVQVVQSVDQQGLQDPQEGGGILGAGVLPGDSQQQAVEVVPLQENLHVLQEEPFTEPAESRTSVQLQYSPLDLRDRTADGSPALVLDFTPPAEDYLDLRNRLKAQQVALETCSLQERLLSGTVQVQNLCFQKNVWVRITFDSWRCFQDVPCSYLNQVYGSPDTNTFSFCICVPEVLHPEDRVEFCVQYQTPEGTFWDNNQGNNYRLVDPSPGENRETENPGMQIQNQKQRDQIDPFGSPRTSVGVFLWQSCGSVETSAPYW